MLIGDYDKIKDSLRKGASPNTNLFGGFSAATVALALYAGDNSRMKSHRLIPPLLEEYGGKPQPLSTAETLKLNHFVAKLRERARKNQGSNALANFILDMTLFLRVLFYPLVHLSISIYPSMHIARRVPLMRHKKRSNLRMLNRIYHKRFAGRVSSLQLAPSIEATRTHATGLP